MRGCGRAGGVFVGWGDGGECGADVVGEFFCMSFGVIEMGMRGEERGEEKEDEVESSGV